MWVIVHPLPFPLLSFVMTIGAHIPDDSGVTFVAMLLAEAMHHVALLASSGCSAHRDVCAFFGGNARTCGGA